MRSYPVKENPIGGSAVSEILRYKQTDKQTDKQTSYYFIIRIIKPDEKSRNNTYEKIISVM